MRAITGAAFLLCIIGANYLTTHYGLVPVGLGLTATAGTYLAGATFVLRDLFQELAGRWWTLALIVAGAVLSVVLAAPQIAVASGVAFLLSETADQLIYSPLRDRGHTVTARILSNTVGAIVDTYVFLTIAGFPITPAVFAGQILAKLTVTLAAELIIGTRARALAR